MIGIGATQVFTIGLATTLILNRGAILERVGKRIGLQENGGVSRQLTRTARQLGCTWFALACGLVSREVPSTSAAMMMANSQKANSFPPGQQMM